MKYVITLIILGGIIFCTTMAVQVLNTTAEKLDEETTHIIHEVGKKVLIDKDTLIIMDYSILNQNYTLSNGVKISFEFEEKAVLK